MVVLDIFQLKGISLAAAVGLALQVLDPQGNVVALAAANGSVCGFHGDHIFPWSRGGLTVRDNLMALQWRANILKKNHILNANERFGPNGQTLADRLQAAPEIHSGAQPLLWVLGSVVR
eukprot:XP_001703752.1 predicted protein [Chlamydomonas reinhardtii]